MDCSICCEKMNKGARKEVKCGFCAYTACLACTKQYLLQSVHQAHCMNCRKEWTLEFLNSVLPKSFLKDEYRSMRETVLFEEEKTYLPPLVAQAENVKQVQRIQRRLQAIGEKIHENDQNEDQLVRDQRALDRKLKARRDELYATFTKLTRTRINKADVKVMMKCPIGECRGFLDEKYHCGLCNTDVCKDCHLAEDDEHKCNPDDVATITELKNTTRPCPKCSVRIYKTDGCDQMFCVKCHTAFSWRTGQEEQGVIHNPHYFETLRAGGIQEVRHRQDHGGCGRIPEYNLVMRRVTMMTRQEKDAMHYMYQQTVHHRHTTMAQLIVRVDRDAERVKYLTGELDEKKFKQRLFVHHQSGLRRQDEHRIMDSHVTVGEELFRAVASDEITGAEAYQQLTLLRELTHKAIVDLDKKYQHKGLVSPNMILPPLQPL